jgi:DNA-binding MarR family transcriptional regulator
LRRQSQARQGAGKIVGALRERGYVVLEPSPTDGREKAVTFTPRGLRLPRRTGAAARRIERDLCDLLGAEAFESLSALLDALGGQEDQPRMRDYLRYAIRLDGTAESP